MKVKLVQDSIIFVSGITKEQLLEANRFTPEALTLCTRDEVTKKSTPIFSIAYADEGSVSENGIVFDSVTEDGYLCKTLVATVGLDEVPTAEEKMKIVSERFASVILKANDLEEQIGSALTANADRIATARQSIETVSLN